MNLRIRILKNQKIKLKIEEVNQKDDDIILKQKLMKLII